MPEVAESAPITFLFAAVDDPAHPDAHDAVAFAGSREMTSRLLDGRFPRPDHPHEFVASKQFVADHGLRLGDHVDVVTWSLAQAEKGQGFSAPPGGPRIDGTLVGVLQSPDNLEDALTFIVFPASLMEADIALGETLVTVDLRPSVTPTQFRAALDVLPDGSALRFATEPLISNDIRRAVDGQAQGTWIIAAVAALAALDRTRPAPHPTRPSLRSRARPVDVDGVHRPAVRARLAHASRGAGRARRRPRCRRRDRRLRPVPGRLRARDRPAPGRLRRRAGARRRRAAAVRRPARLDRRRPALAPTAPRRTGPRAERARRPERSEPGRGHRCALRAHAPSNATLPRRPARSSPSASSSPAWPRRPRSRAASAGS